jgi:general secretion pathway protein A
MGLHANPFPVTPDASNYFISQRIEVCLTELLHCIRERKGFLLVTADVGVGKTTLSRQLIATLEQEATQVALVFNSFLHGVSLLEAINQDFEIRAIGGIREQLEALNQYLLRHFEQEKNCVIIIDDAQNLDIESLELIRQISNLETNTAKLVQILLIAQPEILATLAYPELRQLNSRIALRIELPVFSADEIMDYIHYRLNCAGNGGRIKLTSRALRLLTKISSGYPRRINLIMDRSLYALAANHNSIITHQIIQLAADDLDGAGSTAATWSWRPVWAGIAGTFIVLLVIGIWWGGDRFIKRYETSGLARLLLQPVAALPLKRNCGPVAVKGTVSVVPHVVQTIVSGSANDGDSTPESALPQPAMTFLKAYGMEKFYPDFVRAIASDNWQLFEQIIRPTGWRLLISKRPLSENKAVVYPTTLAGTPHWLILWQPNFVLGPFFWGVRSAGIKRLQEELSELELYSYEIDGVAGSRTMAAVTAFQRRSGLYPSAEPDMLTLYRLNQELGKRKTAPLSN